jgi:hypothetical protein
MRFYGQRAALFNPMDTLYIHFIDLLLCICMFVKHRILRRDNGDQYHFTSDDKDAKRALE